MEKKLLALAATVGVLAVPHAHADLQLMQEDMRNEAHRVCQDGMKIGFRKPGDVQTAFPYAYVWGVPDAFMASNGENTIECLVEGEDGVGSFPDVIRAGRAKLVAVFLNGEDVTYGAGDFSSAVLKTRASVEGLRASF